MLGLLNTSPSPPVNVIMYVPILFAYSVLDMRSDYEALPLSTCRPEMTKIEIPLLDLSFYYDLLSLRPFWHKQVQMPNDDGSIWCVLASCIMSTAPNLIQATQKQKR